MREKIEQKPDFIGIGAGKAGTTWIFQCLKEHPEICVSSKKELFFFDKPYIYRKGIKYYQSFFRHCSKNKIKGEIAPSYIFSLQAPYLIYKHFPNVKLIACLRNPVDIIFSLYKFSLLLKERYCIYKTFEIAIKKDSTLVELGNYYKQLKPYFDLFPRKNILVMFYKDLKNNPIEFIKKIYSFLELNNVDFLPSIINKKINVTGFRIVHNKINFLNSIAYKIRERIRKNKLMEKFLDKSVLESILILK